jgi:hypothetical protein
MGSETMFKKLLLSAAVMVSMSLVSQASFAAGDECKVDKDCGEGKVCVLALTPHQCKAPQAAGAPCVRDAVCASKKCDWPEGKDKGTCK